MEISPSAPLVQAVPVNESGDQLIDLRTQSLIALGPVPHCPDTEPDYSWLRQSIYQRLLVAQRLLPPGLQLRLYEGYRSLQIQTQLFEAEQNRVRARSCITDDCGLWQQAVRRVSAPVQADCSAAIPPHTTGAALGLDIIDSQGEPLDFGMAIADWAETAPWLCLADPPELSSRARQNRQLLKGVMQEAGFIDYPPQWWHFSWGDQYWAWRNGQPAALFGSVEPPCQG